MCASDANSIIISFYKICYEMYVFCCKVKNSMIPFTTDTTMLGKRLTETPNKL